MASTPDIDSLLGLDEAARLAGVTRQTIAVACSTKRLRARKLSRAWVIARADLNDWIAARAAALEAEAKKRRALATRAAKAGA